MPPGPLLAILCAGALAIISAIGTIVVSTLLLALTQKKPAGLEDSGGPSVVSAAPWSAQLNSLLT